MTFVVFYVTNKNKKEAEKLVQLLLKKKLIACANLFPIESHYFWKGKNVKAKEYVSLLKTGKSKAKALRLEIEKNHSYEVPCIMRWKVKANKSYTAWINKETNNFESD